MATRESATAPPSSASTTAPAPPVDEDEPYHDENLRPWQHTLISATAPSLLLNTPRPWPVFVCIAVFHLLVLVGVTAYTSIVCPQVPHGMELSTYRTWADVTKAGEFGCLFFVGTLSPGSRIFEIQRTHPEVSIVNTTSGFAVHGITGQDATGRTIIETMGLAPGQLLYLDKTYYVPCVPDPNGDLLTIYKRNTGDTSLKNLWCKNSAPEDWRRDHFVTLDVCTASAAFALQDRTHDVTDRSRPKTFLHENLLFPINYKRRVCPTYLSALVQGVTVTVYSSVMLLVLIMLFSVILGGSKKLAWGARISSDTTITTTPFDLPSTTSNFREIVKLREAMTRVEAQLAAAGERVVTSSGNEGVGGPPRRGDDRTVVDGGAGSTSQQEAPVMQFYPEPGGQIGENLRAARHRAEPVRAGEDQKNSDEDAASQLIREKSDSYGSVDHVADRSEGYTGLRSRANTRTVSSPALPSRAAGGSEGPGGSEGLGWATFATERHDDPERDH